MQVSKYFHSTEVKGGDVGIEIELEGKSDFPTRIPGWSAHHDGSLRGHSIEYVTSGVLNHDKVEKALDKILQKFKEHEATPVYSFRAGVHVHVNVQSLTLQEVAKFALLYYLFEDALLQWCGDDRYGNLFCLTAAQAEDVIDRVTSSFKSPSFVDFMGRVGRDDLRYASLNWAALKKFGSIEFRGLATQPDLSNIKPWVDVLLHILNKSKEYDSCFSMLHRVSELGPERFAIENLDVHYAKLVGMSRFPESIYDAVWLFQDYAHEADKIEFKDKSKPKITEDMLRDYAVMDTQATRLQPNRLFNVDPIWATMNNPVMNRRNVRFETFYDIGDDV